VILRKIKKGKTRNVEENTVPVSRERRKKKISSSLASKRRKTIIIKGIRADG